MPERRRGQLVYQEVTIQLLTMRTGGITTVAEPGRTIEVSDQGALIEFRTKFDAGGEVLIHNPKTHLNGLFTVIPANPSPSRSSWQVVVELQAADEGDFWCMN